MVLCNSVRVERLECGLICHAVFELAKATHDSRTVSFLITKTIEAHTEFKCEPVDRAKAFELQLTGPEGGKADLLTKVSKVLVCEHRSVPDQLMDDVRFRSILGGRMMADVLRRIKDSKSEAVKEFPLCQQPTDWLQPPTGHAREIVADVVELWDRLC